jgi:hypothetical protein
MELSPITRVAFQLLVAERAMEVLRNDRAGTQSMIRRDDMTGILIGNGQTGNTAIGQVSMFGRPRGNVTEEQETSIQQ